MKKQNILITSAGKRVALVRAFKEALRKNGLDGCVFTTDMSPGLAPAAYASDGCFPVPRVTDVSYVSVLGKLCESHGVGMVIPTIDTELSVLSGCKEAFAERGINVVVSDPLFVSVCRDKRKTGVFFASRGIRVPAEIDKHHPRFPMFAKPYDGSLSVNTHYIKDEQGLTPEIMADPKLMFMEYIDKTEYKEYTVDMYYGRDNRLKSVIPRERVEVRAGEINKGYTRKNSLVPFLCTRLARVEGCVGCICVQLFYSREREDVVGIEINPRFGGGYPLSHMAGGDYPENLIKEYFFHETLDYTDDWRDNLLMLRYDDAIFVSDGGVL